MRTSIILSTYNGEKHIIEQLESHSTQPLLADELIIFDERSTIPLTNTLAT
jgi:GT2 family glycosyltransferase